jgi:DNA-binding SARP family transcriptional activator/class 3 adenylate cyclase
VEFGVLGPLEVRSVAGAAIPLTGPKRRALLALLVLNAGADVPSSRLADELWSGEPPKSASTTLQTFVYQLRRRYGVEELLTTPSGYILNAKPEQIDAYRFERAVDDACFAAIDAPGSAARALGDALQIWRGPAYAEFLSEHWAIGEAARLEQLRVAAAEAWAAASIGAGETAGLAAELEVWTTRNPLREPLWALRVVALVAEGRSAEALRLGTELRAVLRDELGVDPSPQFAAVETAVLRGEPLPSWTELAGLVRRFDHPRVEAPAPQRAGSSRRRRRPARSTRHDDVRSVPPTDRFVGRTPELQALEEAVECAGNGMPQIVVVVGEAGIGKSRMLDEFTPHAIARGVQLLFGACQEDVGIPYLPLASAFASLGAGHNPFDAELLTATGRPDDDWAQLALFLDATRALLAAATERVVMLVIEDLHSADDATLALLRHLVAVGSEEAARGRARLIVVLTTHPPEPGSALEAFIGRLHTGQGTRVIDVRALAAAEVREVATDWLERRPSPATVSLLLDATGGNPLVLRSTLARLREHVGAATISTSSDLLGPTSLDHELWLRVERVGTECMDMLVDAAILGNGASLEWLRRVSDLDRASLDGLIDEAGEHHVLVADDEHYWFDHPQLRQLLYYSTTSAERAACHLRIADRLTTLASDVVVAHHLTRAGTLVEPARLLAVCGKAGDHSAAVGAWRDAAIYASAALEAGSELNLADDELAALELRVGRAAFLARDRDLAITHLTVAAELARSCGALNIWGRAVVRLAREAVEDRDLHSSTSRSVTALEEFIRAADEDEPVLRAEAHALQAELYADRGDLGAARQQIATAEDLVSDLDDDDVRTKVKFARGLHHMMSVELEAARECFGIASPIATRLIDPNPRIWCLIRLGLVAYVTGELARAHSLLSEALTAAHDADNSAEYSMALALAAATAAAQGQFARVEDDAERARRAYRAAEYWFTPAIVFPTVAAARAHRSDGAGALASLTDWDEVQDRRSRRYRPLVEALAGDAGAARRSLESAPFRLFTDRPSPDLLMSGAIGAQAELGALVQMPALVRGPVEALIDLYERGLRFTLGWPSFVPRVVALGLDAVGRENEAEVWFDRALTDAQAAHAEAEVARTALEYGRALHVRGEGARAETLLALASDRYATMSIRPSSAGSELLRPSVATPSPPEGTPATRVVLVTDLAGSTALNDQLGDRDYLVLLREHDEILRGELIRHDGVEFKHTGDGIGAWFYSVNRALECAVALRERFANARAGPTRVSLGVKIALSAGEPALVDGDLLGLSVTVAFRVLDLAKPGEVVATSDVAGLARGLPWSFADRGREMLKGLSHPIDLVSVASSATSG